MDTGLLILKLSRLPPPVRPHRFFLTLGIRDDPALASHGIAQTEELTKHILSLPHLPQKIYCSPYYRCVQTITPLAKALQLPVYIDLGIGEWHGLLHYPNSPDHPVPLDVDKWSTFFPKVDFRRGETGINAEPRGETMQGIHDRVHKALDIIIRQADKDGLHTIILCTHAATNIALGRALTGDPVVPNFISSFLIIGGNKDGNSFRG
jgi:transcription factor C subunit 7